MACDRCSYAFSLEMYLASDSCGLGGDVEGVLEFREGAAYFQGMYWGAAAYSTGGFGWASVPQYGPYYTYSYYGSLYY